MVVVWRIKIWFVFAYLWSLLIFNSLLNFDFRRVNIALDWLVWEGESSHGCGLIWCWLRWFYDNWLWLLRLSPELTKWDCEDGNNKEEKHSFITDFLGTFIDYVYADICNHTDILNAKPSSITINRSLIFHHAPLFLGTVFSNCWDGLVAFIFIKVLTTCR